MFSVTKDVSPCLRGPICKSARPNPYGIAVFVMEFLEFRMKFSRTRPVQVRKIGDRGQFGSWKLAQGVKIEVTKRGCQEINEKLQRSPR